ncbi:MAG: hypothetical protein ACK44A_03600 [Roseateles sp.]
MPVQLVHVGGPALLAEQRQLAHERRQLQVHLVDGVIPERVQQRLVRRVFTGQPHALGHQVGHRQLDQPVGQQVALPQKGGQLLHLRLAEAGQIASGYPAQRAVALVFVVKRAGRLAHGRGRGIWCGRLAPGGGHVGPVHEVDV